MLLEITREGQTLLSSFQETGYCEEVFTSTLRKLALEIKESSTKLQQLTNQALTNNESLNKASTLESDSSSAIGWDSAERKGKTLSPEQKEYLISKGSFQPIAGKFRANEAISKGKQNSFSENWYKSSLFLNTAQALIEPFALHAVYLKQTLIVLNPSGLQKELIVGIK